MNAAGIVVLLIFPRSFVRRGPSLFSGGGRRGLGTWNRGRGRWFFMGAGGAARNAEAARSERVSTGEFESRLGLVGGIRLTSYYKPSRFSFFACNEPVLSTQRYTAWHIYLRPSPGSRHAPRSYQAAAAAIH